jgi:hypothetical protein
MTHAPGGEAVHPDDPEPPLRGRVVIDVANMCRAKEIPVESRTEGFHKAARLRLVVDAWRRIHGADADLRFVTDQGLKSDFEIEGAVDEWYELVDEYGIERQETADGWLLEYAAAERRFVLSDDRFRDFRRKCPWIERQPDRFLVPDAKGKTMRFRPSGIRHEEDYVVSRAEENSTLRGLKYTSSERVKWRLKWLGTRWQCRGLRCRTAQSPYRERLLIPRPGRGDRPVCPDCGGALNDLGPRDPWLEIKVMDRDRTKVWDRFIVESGLAIAVGRGRGDHGVSLDTVVEDEDAQGRISRQHAKLAVDSARRLSVIDLGSRNGTVVQDGVKQPPETLQPDAWRQIWERGWITLGGAVCLVPSGRQHLQSDLPARERSTDDRVTRA